MRTDLEQLTESKELSYIRTCLRYQLFPNQALPVLSADIDWDKLFQLLKWHGLAAYFYTLRASLGLDWPVGFRRQLRIDRDMLLLYGDQCACRVKAVLSSLCTSGMDVIVLKGWAFIQTLYNRDYSLRFCEDIDILVRPQDSLKAAGILKELGYQSLPECWPGYHQRYLNAQAFILADQPKIYKQVFSVGLHWGLLHPPFYNPEQPKTETLFTYARLLNVAGVDVLELSIEDQILYSCAHLGLHHKYDEALHYYFEIGALICHGGTTLDWATIIQRAWEWQCIIPLRRVLVSLEELWPGLVSADVLQQIKALSPVFLERFVDWWFGKTSDRPSFEHLLMWVTTPGWRRRLGMAFQMIFPSPAYLRKKYGPAPSGFWLISYIWWLIRFVQGMGRSPAPESF